MNTNQLFLTQARVNTVATDSSFSGSTENVMLLIWAFTAAHASAAFEKQIRSEANNSTKKNIVGPITCKQAIWASDLV